MRGQMSSRSEVPVPVPQLTPFMRLIYIQSLISQIHKKKKYTHLPAINNFLIEDSKFVADAISIRSQTQRGHGVQEAS